MGEALGIMQRAEGLSAVLGPLVSRVHRLPSSLLISLLGTAVMASAKEASDLADAASRAVVERGDVAAKSLSEMVDAASALAMIGKCQTGPRTGLELLFQHVTRRAREAPAEFEVYMAKVVESAQSTGHATPA